MHLPISASSGLPIKIQIIHEGFTYEGGAQNNLTADPRYFQGASPQPIKWGYNSLTDQYGLFIKETGEYQVVVSQQGNDVYAAAQPLTLSVMVQGKDQTYSMTNFPENLVLTRKSVSYTHLTLPTKA